MLEENVVDLSTAKTDTRGLKDTVTAAQHHHAASLGVQAHVVTVVPDFGPEDVEVTLPVLLQTSRPGWPEHDWLGGKRCNADKITRLAGFTDIIPGIVEY